MDHSLIQFASPVADTVLKVFAGWLETGQCSLQKTGCSSCTEEFAVVSLASLGSSPKHLLLGPVPDPRGPPPPSRILAVQLCWGHSLAWTGRASCVVSAGAVAGGPSLGVLLLPPPSLSSPLVVTGGWHEGAGPSGWGNSPVQALPCGQRPPGATVVSSRQKASDKRPVGASVNRLMRFPYEAQQWDSPLQPLCPGLR